MLALISCLLLIATVVKGYEANTLWTQPQVPVLEQEREANALVYRLLGDRAAEFQLRVDPQLRSPDGRDAALILGGELTVEVVGSSGVAASWALHYYLQQHCGVQVSWDHQQLALPRSLPSVNTTLKARDLFRYYANTCTFGYSFVWWQWKDWERHIDWMALNGINLPLAQTGQEEIWRRVWRHFGLTEEEVDEHFAGPAFLPWGRMGNLRGWGGPLPRSWHKLQVELQHQILERMRGLGMLPVLPGFAGQVPDAFVERYPGASFTKQTWKPFKASNLSGVYMLSPLDPLFVEIGDFFLAEQKKEFGTNHIYSVDPFNELLPPNSSVEYLSSVGRAVFQGLASDNEAVWLMQGWLFMFDQEFWGIPQVEALLTSVPKGQLLVLDLDSTDREQYTRTASYSGQPFIFNMIHTFGGQLAMFGRKDHVNQRPEQARKMVNSTMVGTGFAMEGIHNSYVMYELLSEMSWRQGPIEDLLQWFFEYAARRYGVRDPLAGRAWQLLAESVYSSTVRNFHGKVLIVRPPKLGIRDLTWYPISSVLTAWELLLAAAPNLSQQPSYLYDLVDVTRQALANLAPSWYFSAEAAYRRGDVEDLHIQATTFIELLEDLERVLATRREFLLGPWLEAAKALATTDAESRLYEFNARNQITLWGPDGQILDYAGKQWAGLVSKYYIPRWKMFFKTLEQCLLTGKKFDSDEFKRDFVKKQGTPFTTSRTLFPTEAEGDTLQVVREVHAKWRPYFHLADNLDQ